jgi:hypothetical protein
MAIALTAKLARGEPSWSSADYRITQIERIEDVRRRGVAAREALAASRPAPDVVFPRWLARERAGCVFNPRIRVIRG